MDAESVAASIEHRPEANMAKLQELSAEAAYRLTEEEYNGLRNYSILYKS
jgi:hypothetical protein